MAINLPNSLRYYELVLENMEEWIMICDQNGKIIYYNHSEELFYRYPKEDFTVDALHNYYSIYKEDTTTPLETKKTPLYEALNGKIIIQKTVSLKGMNGQIFYFNVNGHPLKEENGEIAGAIIVASDVTAEKETKRALVDTEEKYKLVTENTNDLLYVLNEEGVITYSSPSNYLMFGYTSKELNGKPAFQFIHESYHDTVQSALNEAILTLQPVKRELRIMNKQNQAVYVEARGVPVVNNEENNVNLIVVARDITERKKTECFLIESEERYRSLVDLSPVTVFVHMNRTVVYINQTGVNLFEESSKSGIIGKKLHQFTSFNDQEKLLSEAESVVSKKGRTTPVEMKIRTMKGNEMTVEATSSFVYYEGKEAIQTILVDITERKKAQDQVKHMAYHDPLTDLPNRRFFQYTLINYLKEAKNKSASYALLLLDIDNFKMINDIYSHSFGDKLLVKLARRLQIGIGNKAMLYRVSGDEFAVLLSNIDDERDAIAMAENILIQFKDPFHISNVDCSVSTSIGITYFPKDGNDPDTLMKNADMAMYWAKKKGKNNIALYSKQLNDQFLERKKLEDELKTALLQNQLKLFYQPIFELKTGEIKAVEALLRWQHPKKGLILPSEFIPIAEETGLIVPIGEWVIREACSQWKKWTATEIGKVFMKVNLSAKQFYQSDLVKVLEDIIVKTKIDPQYLELEVTESIMMQQSDQATQCLKELKQLGLRLSLDDFGTGFSSLSYLKNFPIDTLKIDRSFVWDIAKDSKNEAIVRTVISLAKALHLEVVAEGVENVNQLDFLSNEECDYIQGFLFSKPIRAEEIEKDCKRLREAAHFALHQSVYR